MLSKMSRVRAWFRRAVMAVRYAWELAVALWRVYVLSQFAKTSPFTVHKVYAVNEETEAPRTVTRYFRAERDWETSVRLATGWSRQRIRVEVRYLSHGAKYRMVLRPGDAWPSIVPEPHRGPARGVFLATLMRRTPGDPHADVTDRVLRYQGPRKDFHSSSGLRVGVCDMFPLVDRADLLEEFRGLQIAHSQGGRMLTTLVPMECNDIAGLLARTTG